MKLNTYIKAGTKEYFYLLALYNLTKNKINKIGNDNGYIDGYKHTRSFKIQQYEGEYYLNETKTSKACAEYTRTFKIMNYKSVNPSFKYVSDWEH